MKIAFCLFKYFPYGGLQRDFLRIAKTCQQRGHTVHVYTTEWQGEHESGFHVHIIPVKGKQNHTRNQSFATKVKTHLAKLDPHVVVGFNKMPHLDVYYAADVCYQARAREQRHFLYRLLPRYRQLVALEKAVFAHEATTEIMLIAPKEQPVFTHYYHTEATRFHILPPGISKDRIPPSHSAQIRASVRQRHQLTDQHKMLLMVGSGFKTKGLDRAIYGLAALPPTLKAHTQLFVIGQDNPTLFKKLAAKLQITSQIHFLGGRSDVPDYLLAADALVHPAYHENTGTVLLEAMIAGLAVLTMDVCGYAHYIEEVNTGIVLHSPFQQSVFNKALETILISTQRQQWQQNGLAFAQIGDIYHLPQRATDIIERVGEKNVSR
jgi:UDP-glucose:(heptosyl)LPS alpha-1,3-glucosyltransferase